MASLFRDYRLSNRITLAETLNTIVHILRLGSKFGTYYRFFGLKRVLYALWPFFSFLKELVQSGAVFVFFLIMASTAGNMVASFLEMEKAPIQYGHVFYFYLVGAVFSTRGLDYPKYFRDVETFGFAPKSFFLQNSILRPAMIAICRLVIFTIYAMIISLSIFPIWAYVIGLFLTELAANALAILSIKHRGKAPFRSYFSVMAILIGVVLGIGLLQIFQVNLLSVGIFLPLIALLPAFFAVRTLAGVKEYGRIVEHMRGEGSKIEEEFEKAGKTAELREKDYRSEHTGKKGFAYLNHLFFKRHRRMIMKPVYIRTVILALLLTGGLFLISRLTIKEDLMEVVPYVVPFIVYMTSTFQGLTQIFYENCDESLFVYGFYRRPNALLHMAKNRLVSMVGILLYPTGVLLIGTAILGLLIGSDVFSLLITFLVIVLYGLFYAVFPLFLYYVFAPYKAGAGKVIAAILQFMLYAVTFFGIPQLIDRLDVHTYLIGTILFFVVFFILAGLLIYKRGPEAAKKS